MSKSTMDMAQILDLGPVVPVLTIGAVDHAVPMARALVKGGLTVIEVTLRTPCALDAIKRISEEVEEACVGAGTVLTPRELDLVQSAGARFAVSPGATTGLLSAAGKCGLPLLPGVATPSEIMQAMDLGYRSLKFFPAEASGGITMLKALRGPFPDIRFCPTGGIREENLASYLSLDNVAAVGGTWLTPADLVAGRQWDKLQVLAARAMEIARG